MTKSSPKFEDMIPWTGGECPWYGEVYVLLEGSSLNLLKGLASRYCWEHNSHVSKIIAYMPVQLWEEAECSRPKDFIGRNLFEKESLESLFELYSQYKREKQDSETMMQKVLEEIKYRTPDGWYVGLCDDQEYPSEDVVETKYEVNDWQNWSKGDILECVEAPDDCWTKGNKYRVIDMDYNDPENPVQVYDDDHGISWPDLELDAKFVKVEK